MTVVMRHLVEIAHEIVLQKSIYVLTLPLAH